MTFLAYVFFTFNIVVIGFLVYFAKAAGMKVKFTRLREWKGIHKFGTLPLIAFIVLMFVGLSAMNADTQNKIDRMYADAGKTRPVVQSEPPKPPRPYSHEWFAERKTSNEVPKEKVCAQRKWCG